MANEELLKRLKQGVKEWNQWRLQHPDLHPNLSGLNLSTVDLSMTRLSNVKLRITVSIWEKYTLRTSHQEIVLKRLL